MMRSSCAGGSSVRLRSPSSSPTPPSREPWLTFAIVGAGPTGVELAGQIAELSRRALRDNFRSFDPAEARIVLLDGLDTVLASYPERLRRRAQRDLERLGVELRLGTRVVGVDETGLDVSSGEGETGRIEARTKIWAAGVQASPLGRMLTERAGATVDRAGRVEVEPDCSLPGHPEVFVVGDLMALNGLPGLAEVAMQSGRHSARTIVRRLRGRPTKPFRYVDLGTMATIARFRAVVEHRTAPDRGLHRMADVARRPPHVPHRLQEPRGDAGQLDRRVPRARPTPAHHHQAGSVRARARTRDANRETGLCQRKFSKRQVRDDRRQSSRHRCAGRAARADAVRGGRDARPRLLRDRVRGLHHRHLPQAASEQHQGRRRRAAGADGAAARRPREGGRLGVRHPAGGDRRRRGARRPPARPQRGVRADRQPEAARDRDRRQRRRPPRRDRSRNPRPHRHRDPGRASSSYARSAPCQPATRSGSASSCS